MAQSISSHYPLLLGGDGLLLRRARSLMGIGINGLFIGHPLLICKALWVRFWNVPEENKDKYECQARYEI